MHSPRRAERPAQDKGSVASSNKVVAAPPLSSPSAGHQLLFSPIRAVRHRVEAPNSISVIRRTAIGIASTALLLATTAMGAPSASPAAPAEYPERESVTTASQPLAAAIVNPILAEASAIYPSTELATEKASLAPLAKEAAIQQTVTQDNGPKLLPLPAWVEAVKEVVVWTGQGEQASARVTLPTLTAFKVLGQAEKGKLPVYYDEGDAGSRRFGGWVVLADIKAAESQDRVSASSRGGTRPTPDLSTQDRFITAVAVAAQASQRDSGVPASVTIAQAILESDWGKSQLSKKASNYFGIKSISGPGPAGVIMMNTWEVLSGKDVTVKDGFKAYHNLDESVLDHGRFLRDNKRYAPAFQVPGDSQEFARRIHAAGYATDPGYSTKLINLMNRLSLCQYDLR